jgi:hypothetical protein
MVIGIVVDGYARAIDGEDVVADGVEVLGDRCLTGFLPEPLWAGGGFGRVKLAAVRGTDEFLDLRGMFSSGIIFCPVVSCEFW